MQVRELVERGALVAAHGAAFLQRHDSLRRRHMDQYWTASRCRQHRWAAAIKKYTSGGIRDASANWAAMRPVIEEIVASELLTRTWAAVACACDHKSGVREFGPIVRSVLVGHIEARSRGLNVMIYGQGFTVEGGVELNRLRRQTERWTDMLLAYLVDRHEVAEFAFNAQRCRDFASDLRYESNLPGGHAWKLALASLRAAFHNGLTASGPNQDLNQRIASSILACFHSDLFDSSGLLKSLWMVRLDHVADDTQGLLDLLTREESASGRFSVRQR